MAISNEKIECKLAISKKKFGPSRNMTGLKQCRAALFVVYTAFFVKQEPVQNAANDI